MFFGKILKIHIERRHTQCVPPFLIPEIFSTARAYVPYVKADAPYETMASQKTLRTSA